jgi:hypothetical protein
MLRRTLLAVLLAVAALAHAEDQPDFVAIIVRFDIDADGRLHMTEQVTVNVPPSVQRLERTYWEDAEQIVTFDAITLYDTERTVKLEESTDLDRAHHFHDDDWPGRVVWSVRDKAAIPAETRTLTYVIESHISDAVIPAWSIPRGKVLSDDSASRLGDPRERLREVIPFWREARKNPRHRFVVDYQFNMPPPSIAGTSIQLQLYWPPGWQPVHEITPDTVAQPIARDFANPDRYRLQHLFEEDGRHLLTSVDDGRHGIRMASLAGLPIAGLLLWLLFVLIAFLRRPRGSEDAEQLVRDAVYRLPPEKVEAEWSGRAPHVTIDQFLRRLERERKVAISLDKNNVKNNVANDVATLRLLVPREQLTPYEGLGIQILLRDAWETTSEDVRRRSENENFDAERVLNLAVQKTAAEGAKNQRAPWYSRATSFAMIAAGLFLSIQELVRYNREPAMLFATLMASVMLYSIWPDSITREAVRGSLRNALFLLIPLAIFTGIAVAAHFAASTPPGFYASAGMSIAFLGAYKAILANNAPRGDGRLIRARNWLRNELKSPTPRLRDDTIPWLNALGLQRDIARWKQRNDTAESRFRSSQWTGNPPPETDAEWDGAFITE